MRERHGFQAEFFPAAGITPARAGKTGHNSEQHNSHEDHPRSCGKDSGRLLPVSGLLGSPPLVRERRYDAYTGLAQDRITPARAGKTQSTYT